MTDKFKNKYRIESNRARFWDYSAPGRYFITICTKNREHYFGDISNGIMHYTRYGEIVKNEFLKIPEYHKRVILDEWIVMPNHVHCIIELGDYDFDNGISDVGDNVEKIHEFSLRYHQHHHPKTIDEIKQYRRLRRKMIIPKLLGKFQMQTSKHINLLRGTIGQQNWQTDYFDHIIRNDKSYQRIKQYIINNPKNWNRDKFKI